MSDQVIERARRAVRKLSGATHSLESLTVDEISLVDRPAVPRAVIAIRKRDALQSTIAKAQAARAVLMDQLGGIRSARVLKASAVEELRFLSAVVATPDEVDRQGDWMSAEVIRRAAWGYLAGTDRTVGLQHEAMLPAAKARVVESWIAPTAVKLGDVEVPSGSWVIGIHVPDDALWAKVKSGEIGGVSLGGRARKVAVGKAASIIDAGNDALVRLGELREGIPTAKPGDAREAIATWLSKTIRALGGDVPDVDNNTANEPTPEQLRAWIDEAQRSLSTFATTASSKHVGPTLAQLLAAGCCNRLLSVHAEVTR
jgi:hypothetical protein